MARTMYDGLTHKIVTCCEAEVGTGKTLAYLVASLAARMFNPTYKHTGYPVTIATSSIELQKAIMENEIPMLSKMLMDYGIIKKPLNAVLRKGKEHYFCIARYNDYFKNLGNHPDKNEELIAALKKVRPDLYCFDLDKAINIPSRVKARINVKGNCTNCPQWIGCRYYQHIADASVLYDIDFQITNHNMYLMNLQMGSKLLLPCNYCIIDEAHKLAETSAQVFGCEIESGAVDKFLNAVRYNENPKLISRPNFKSALAEATYANNKLFDYLKIEATESEDDGEMQKLNFRLTEKVQDLIMVKKPKTKNSVRTVIIDTALLKVLHELKQKSESEWIFASPVKTDSPLNPQTVYRKTQQILERAECKKVRFHDLRHTFATMSLENGMDIKTLSNMIGHSSVATTLDIYSHITDEMLKNASRVIDRGIGKEINRPENEIEIAMKQEVTPPTKTDFTAYKGKIRKSGTGGIYKLNDHLYEGRYTPTNAYGKRESCNVYGKTYEECEAKLEEMIARKRAEIAAEKERLKAMQTA